MMRKCLILLVFYAGFLNRGLEEYGWKFGLADVSAKVYIRPHHLSEPKQERHNYARIVGGQPAEVPEWRFIVKLVFNMGLPHWKVCGGSILNRWWIITAAHCVFLIREHPNLVRIGILMSTVHPKMSMRRVKKIKIHHLFNFRSTSGMYKYDIALLKLHDRLPDFIPDVHLPQSAELRTTSKMTYNSCKAGGYGSTRAFDNTLDFINQNFKSSNQLKIVDIPVASQQECEQAFANYRYLSNAISAHTLCGGYIDKENIGTPCIGDSGGPLVCRNSTGKLILLGIVISGNPHCRPGEQYTLFTSVSHFSNWIRRTMGQHPSDL